MQNSAVLKLDGILPGDTSVSLVQLNRLIFHKVNFSSTGKCR
jgi:hypothetical protein